MKTLISKQSDGGMLCIIAPAHTKEFCNLVQRGMNLNPNASPAMKACADYIMHGKMLQDYDTQNYQKFPPSLSCTTVQFN